MGHRPVVHILQAITQRAARHPQRTIFLVTLLALVLCGTGLLTNFNIDVDEDTLWTPRNSQAANDKHWLDFKSGFPQEPRWLVLLFHHDGQNVLGQSQVQRMFDVVDAIRSVGGYQEMCAETGHVDNNGDKTCKLEGPVNFWNASTAIFQEQVSSDQEAIEQLSARQFPDLFPVAEEVFFGFPERDEQSSDLLTSAVSYSIFIEIPQVAAAEDVEAKALDAVLAMDDQWRADPDSNLYVEVAAHRSFPDEFTRAIIIDIPLGEFVMRM